MNLRLFVAVDLPGDLKEAIWRAVEPLRHALPRASWVPVDRLHLTLRFLGDTAPAAVPSLSRSLLARMRTVSPFGFMLAGAGVFPNLRRPRVVWIGTTPGAELAALARQVDAACDGEGFVAEGRPFAAHLTVGRIRTEPGAAGRARLAAAIRIVGVNAVVPVAAVMLMQSTPGAGTSHYRVLASFPLLGDGSSP